MLFFFFMFFFFFFFFKREYKIALYGYLEMSQFNTSNLSVSLTLNGDILFLRIDP